MKSTRLAYLVSHPIQYQAPLLRRIAREEQIDLHVLFMSDFSVRPYFDEGFGREVAWDVPLTEGYSHEFLPRKMGTGDTSPDDIRTVGLSKIISKGKYDVLWSHGYHHRTNLSALLTAKKLGIKTLLRSDIQEKSKFRKPGLVGNLKAFGVKQILKLGDGFLTAGQLNAEYYKNHGVPEERLFTMPYAIDNDYFREAALEKVSSREGFRSSLNLEPGRPVILFASKLQARKRVMDLFNAFCYATPSFVVKPYLLIIGDGEEMPILEQAVREKNLSDDIRILGFKNQTELPAFFGLCDVFVLPSAREPWALVVNEVMCASKAIVLSDECGCAPDLVHPGVNGYIHKVGDIEGLGKALCMVLENPDKPAKMGEASWEIIKDWDFEADVVALHRAISYVRGK